MSSHVLGETIKKMSNAGSVRKISLVKAYIEVTEKAD